MVHVICIFGVHSLQQPNFDPRLVPECRLVLDDLNGTLYTVDRVICLDHLSKRALPQKSLDLVPTPLPQFARLYYVIVFLVVIAVIVLLRGVTGVSCLFSSIVHLPCVRVLAGERTAKQRATLAFRLAKRGRSNGFPTLPRNQFLPQLSKLPQGGDHLINVLISVDELRAELVNRRLLAVPLWLRTATGSCLHRGHAAAAAAATHGGAVCRGGDGDRKWLVHDQFTLRAMAGRQWIPQAITPRPVHIESDGGAAFTNNQKTWKQQHGYQITQFT